MSFDDLQFRQALGRFATGVCVITANPEGHVPFGLTVNSFASLSLTPPLVLWSLQKTSDTMDAFRAAKRYCANVLSSDQRAMSGRFSRKGEHALHGDQYFEVPPGYRCCMAVWPRSSAISRPGMTGRSHHPDRPGAGAPGEARRTRAALLRRRIPGNQIAHEILQQLWSGACAARARKR